MVDTGESAGDDGGADGRERAGDTGRIDGGGAPGDDDRIDGEEDAGDPLTRRLNALITEHPRLVVLTFLLASGVFAAGLGDVGDDREAGPDQFTYDVEEYRALQEMNERFAERGRGEDTSSLTVYVSDDRNVLSRDGLLRLIEFELRMQERYGDRVETESFASVLAEAMTGGEADTLERQRFVLERATEGQVELAIRRAHEAGVDLGPVSTDFHPEAGSASVTQVGVHFDVAPGAAEDDESTLHYETMRVVDGVDGLEAGENAIVLSGHVVTDEINQLLSDTVVLVFPTVVILIGLFLLVAYRDPFDVALGAVALVLTLLWTFGFIGHAGIPFSDALIPVFPLLLAVGIDFGVHIINRYREERAAGTPIADSMRLTTDQLGTAFVIVTITTIFGFVANLTAPLEPLRNFGIVASAGMIFTFLLFGVFLPACKVSLDRLREGTGVPEFGTDPMGAEGSALGRLLGVGAHLARVAPVAVLVAAVVLGVAAGAYGTGVGTEFSQEAFFPDEERVETYQALPDAVEPSQYTFIDVVRILEEEFERGWIGWVTVYVDDPDVSSGAALADVDRALAEPPAALESEDRRAEAGSILDPIERLAEEDEEFAALVDASDRTGNGVPDRNVDAIYDELLASNVSDEASYFLAEDRGATRIVYELHVDTDDVAATAAANDVADDMQLDATPTGDLVVQQTVVQHITTSAFNSLAVAFVLTAVFLMGCYRWLEGRAVYGLVNLLPVLVVVALLMGTMRYFDIPFSPYNAPILAVSIGLGVDYTVHFMHRFVDEFEGEGDLESSLLVTIRGTGGALTGSMLTTACGLGALYVAVIPLIMEFGLLLALGVIYAYVAAVVVLPSTIVAWFALERRLQDRELPWS